MSGLLELIFRPIINRLESLMASAEQLQAQLTEAKTSLQAAIDRVAEDVQALKDRADQGIDPADLDPISAGLEDLKNNLDALDPDPNNPAPKPDEPPQG